MKLVAFLVAVVAIGCSAPVVSDGNEVEPEIDADCEDAAPLEPIRVGDGCWEDPSCDAKLRFESDELCGRAYMCERPQVDGSYKDVCVVARDCDCLIEAADCGLDVDWPGYCGYPT